MRCSRPLLIALLLVTGACGGEAGSGTVGGVDTSEAGLVALLRERRYQDWLAEPAIHGSTGPHGKVRTFFNATVVDSLRASNSIHPLGSILIKELYASDGQTLNGHAASIKVAEGVGKDTWLFFEGFSPDYRDNYYGRGHPSCHGCHAAGQDYVTTSLP